MTPSFRRFALISTVAVSALAAATLSAGAPAHAQSDDSRYGTWAPPGSAGTQTSQDPRLGSLLKELNTLINEAEKARAADRLFLRDLRDLAARYENPWTRRVLFDDFADGDFQRNPAWSVTSGEFWVERGYGLRARVTDAPAQSSEPRQVTKEEAIIGILGAVLQGANKNGGGATTTTAPPKAAPARIETRATVPNAFAVNLEMSSWTNQGAFEMAVTQGLSGAGYRVVYTAGQNPSLELVKVTSRGRGVVDAKAVTALEDKKVHVLAWTRAKDGAMTVAIDGKQVLSARDVGFRDPFDGLAIQQAGTDVIVKSVNVMGAP